MIKHIQQNNNQLEFCNLNLTVQLFRMTEYKLAIVIYCSAYVPQKTKHTIKNFTLSEYKLTHNINNQSCFIP